MDAHVAVRHVLDVVEIGPLFGYFQAAQLLVVAEIRFTVRIAHLDAIQHVPVIVKARDNRPHGDAPRAARVAGQFDGNLSHSAVGIVGRDQHLARIGSDDPKGDPQIGMNAGVQGTADIRRGRLAILRRLRPATSRCHRGEHQDTLHVTDHTLRGTGQTKGGVKAAGALDAGDEEAVDEILVGAAETGDVGLEIDGLAR